MHNAQTHGKSVGGDTCPFNILLQEEILLKSVKWAKIYKDVRTISVQYVYQVDKLKACKMKQNCIFQKS